MRFKAMNLYNHAFKTKDSKSMYLKYNESLHYERLLKFFARAIILALVILSFTAIGDLFNANDFSSSTKAPLDSIMPLVLRNLANEGLIKSTDKALLITDANQESVKEFNNVNMDVIQESNLEQQQTLFTLDDTFDLVFANNYNADTSDYIDRWLKTEGVLVLSLDTNPNIAFEKPYNYNIVYLGNSESTTVIAMRKNKNNGDSSATRRKLLGETKDNAKEAALKNLEDVLLEPPRSSSGKSRKYLRQTRYLPDLMGDSLENYPRRVFIDVSPKADSNWFVKQYPTRNKDFEIYKIDTVAAEASYDHNIEMSDWLTKNVKENEYVVMKAEAEVVEEMVKSKTIKLVDELFLECKHQGTNKKDHKNKSKRPYWECLSLYGVLRDEGIAVHQWWG